MYLMESTEYKSGSDRAWMCNVQSKEASDIFITNAVKSFKSQYKFGEFSI